MDAFSDEYLHALALLRNGDFEDVVALSATFKNPIESRLALALAQEEELDQFEIAAKGFQAVLQNPEVRPHQIAPAAQGLVRIEKARGDFYAAIYWAEDSLQNIRKAGGGANAEIYPLQATLSSVYLEVGDFAKALELVKSSVPTADNDWNRVISRWSEGTILYTQGKFAQAAILFREAYALTLEHDRKMSQMRLLQTMVWVEAKSDQLDFAQGRAYLEMGKAHFTEQNATYDLANLLNTYAVVELKAGEFVEAEAKARASLEMSKDLPDFERAHMLTDNAEVLQHLIAPDEVRQLLSAALGILVNTKANRAVATVWARLGEVYSSIGDNEAAFACYKASVEAAGLVPAKGLEVS